MPHIVKRGETLGKIARDNGITLAQLLNANPQFRANPDIVHPGDTVIIPGEESGLPPQPVTVPTGFAGRLASIARERHDRFQFVNEADPILCGQIKKWTEDIGGVFVSCTSNAHPWSAVFVSSCVKEAGAKDTEFKFSKRHSVFVHKAIQDGINGTGVFHGLEMSATPRKSETLSNIIEAALDSPSITRGETRNTHPTRWSSLRSGKTN